MSSDLASTPTRIIAAARSLLEAPAGTSLRMSDIAKAAGLSRQAVYLHFKSRAEVLIAVTDAIDRDHGLEARLSESRAAATGAERLDAWISFWGGYLPDVRAAADALLRIKDNDPEAAAAWDDRMAAMRSGCAAAIGLLAQDGRLAPPWSPETATDLLWTMLSFQTWDTLTRTRGWTPEDYVRQLTIAARSIFVAP
jgi:AcrR family transcriptional regulator